jgi:hypothetical protein
MSPHATGQHATEVHAAQPDAAAQGPSRRTLRRLGAATIGLVLVVAGVVLTGPAAEEFPLDPDSSADDGLLGIVRLLEELDVQVEVTPGVPSDLSTRVFVPVDQLGSTRRAELVRFAEDGGTVIVAGASSQLHGLDVAQNGGLVDALGRTSREPDCAELDQVAEVFQDGWTGLEVPPEATACFPDGDGGAWLVSVPTGDGTIVALGSARPFTNQLLDEADNAVLAATLLGPSPGERLVVVPRGEIGEGDTPLLELVPAGFIRALWLLLAALLAGVLWRARRLGPPVEERLPPVLPSAELARSVAGLLQRAGDRGAAAGRIREDLRQEVRRALQLPIGTPSSRLVELLPRRSAVTEDDARVALLDAPIDHDRDLTALAAAASRVRLGLRGPAPATTDVTAATESTETTVGSTP